MEENFINNQSQEREEFENQLVEAIKTKVRPSSKLLNFQYRMDQLSKYQRFEEAAKLKDEYDIEVGSNSIYR